ncbi:DDB1- and CUL4-associated factor 6-like isoform X2 [Aphidius gifuensis]|uniref:DDB1- and CUL4-associated factor 6-like isoform X2 n=1 Tax=Aphidius gifuensis TaxID=684658 RepID=UPI001CDB9915|nr:DDB1- and CUL4-associated factor 6-like isoform X2 [Aphidius gifuensis]
MKRTKTNLFYDIYNQPYDYGTRLKLYSSSKASLELLQRMSLVKRLKVHNGCVNSICWNDNGDLILSGSDDQHLVLTNVYNYKVLTDYKTSHRANIFSAKFLPNSGDHRIVSCSGDGIILYTDLMRKTETFNNQFTCHNGTTYEIATIPSEPHSFLSCGEDCTVRYFDLRIKSSCNTPRCKEGILISCQRAVTAMSVNPITSHYLAVGCSDSTVRIYDRRMLSTRDPNCTDNNDSITPPISLFTVPEFDGSPYRITSLSYSPDGNDVLVSYSSDHLYLFSVKDQGIVKFKTELPIEKSNKSNKKQIVRSPQPVRRLRLRGDWSDTGPDARPEREGGRRNGTEIAQARPVLHTSLMQRMTDVLSRMLNDPATRAALSGGGEDSLEGVIDQHAAGVQQDADLDINNEERNSDAQSSMDTESNAQAIDDSIETGSMGTTIENNLDSTNTESLGDDEPESDDINSFPIQQLSDNSNNDVLQQQQQQETSQSENTKASIQSFTTLSISQDDNEHDDNNSVNQIEENPIENVRDENMMENLQDRLTTMRDGYLEKHGSEPAVSLTYSDKSSTGATISMGVGNEVMRDNYHPGPSGSQSSATAGPSRITQTNYSSIHEQTDEDVYNDSDDDDGDDTGIKINPIGVEIDKSERRNSLGQNETSFDDITSPEIHVKQKYMGHRNARTMIKEANFWGDNYVMSGSDCGHVFIWDRETAKLCMLLEADQHVVNCLQPHPFLPMLATSGIDYDVKLWSPINEESNFDCNFAEDLQKRNAVMLEETKDTITVPAVFMIRMLACLNQIRRGRGRNRRRSGDEADDLRGG